MFRRLAEKIIGLVWLNFGRPYVFQGDCPACGNDHSNRTIRVKQDGKSLYAICPSTKARIDLSVMDE